jgi:hypothetical protein
MSHLPRTFTVIAFVWLISVGFAGLLLSATAIGMYEAVLIAEVASLAVLAVSFLVWRKRAAPSGDDLMVIRSHRERRGF